MKRIKALIIPITLAVILLTSVTGCKKKGDEDDTGPYKGMSASQLWADSKKALDRGQYASSIKRLEALESMYPFNDFATEAQLKLVYAYYKNEEYPAAAATAERFTHLYPRDKHVDYAYYMKALANFQQARGPLANIFPMDQSWRDTGSQAQSFADFSLLVQRFPESRFKPDALQRMIFLRNLFAQREMNTANYYFKRKMFVAAAERASFVIKSYPQSSSARGALALLYRANIKMGLEQAAEESLAVYRATYHSDPVR